MITLYSHGCPNGHKASIALQELDLPHTIRHVNVFAGEGRTPEYLAINPAGKVPAIRDEAAGLTLTESNAILLYLADKAAAMPAGMTGVRLVPADGADRTRALELLFLQASLVGPMFGQRFHFSMFGPETVPYAIRRYEEQGEQIDALCDGLLATGPYFLGADYSIVDIAFFGWYHAAQKMYPLARQVRLQAWFDRVAARPAVQRGLQLPTPLPTLPPRRRLEATSPVAMAPA